MILAIFQNREGIRIFSIFIAQMFIIIVFLFFGYNIYFRKPQASKKSSYIYSQEKFSLISTLDTLFNIQVLLFMIFVKVHL